MVETIFINNLIIIISK